MTKPLTYDELVNSNFDVQDAMRKRDNPSLVTHDAVKNSVPVETLNPDAYREWYDEVLRLEKGKDTKFDTAALAGDLVMSPLGLGDFTSGAIRNTESTISNVFLQTPFFLMSDLMGGAESPKIIKPIEPSTEPGFVDKVPAGSDAELGGLVLDAGKAILDAIRHPFLEESRNPVRPVDTVIQPGDSKQEQRAKKFARFGLLVHAKDRMIQQSVQDEVQSPTAFAVGGVAASISRTFLYNKLGGPKLAIGLMSGEVASRKFVEQRAAGVSWVPSLVFSTTLGIAEGSLERISLGIMNKKMRSVTGIVIDSMISNSIEEALQSLAEAGLEQTVGFQDRGFKEVIANALYEGMLGSLGGLGASPVVVHSYGKIKKQFTDLKVPEKKADEITSRVFEQGIDIYMDELSNVLGVPRALLEQTSKIQADIKSKKKSSDEGFKEISDLVAEQVMKEQTKEILDEAKENLTPEEVTELERLSEINTASNKIRKARSREIEKRLDLLEEKKKAVQKEIEKRTPREGKDKPTKALQNKLAKLDAQIEVLLDERDSIPEATVADLQKSDLNLKTEELGRITKLVRAQQTAEIKAQLKLEFKQAKDNVKEAQSALRRHIRARLGQKEVPAKLLRMIQEVKPGQSLDQFTQAVDEIADAKILKDLANQVTVLLEKLNPKKIPGVNPKGPYKGLFRLKQLADQVIEWVTTPVAEAQATIRENAAKIETLLNEQGKDGVVDENVGSEISDLQFENQMLSDLAGFDMENNQFVGVTTEQAQKIVDKLKGLSNVIRGNVKLRRDTVKAEQDAFIKSVSDDIMKKGKGKNSRSKVMSILRNINEWNEAMALSLPARLKVLNGAGDKFSAFQEELIKPLEQATLNYFNVMDFFSNKMADNYSAYGTSDKDAIAKINEELLNEEKPAFEKEITLIDGTKKKLKLTRNQVIQLYLYAYEDENAAKRGEDSGDGWEILTGDRQLKELIEKAKLGGPDGAAIAAALDEVSNFIASLDATSQRIEDGDGNVVANVNPGFPDALKGYKTSEMDAVIRNIKNGKELTEKQNDIKEAMLSIAEDMGILQKEGPRDLTQAELDSIKGNKLGGANLLDIFADMSTEDKAFANNLRVFYQQFYQFINPTYQKVFGISLTQEQNYVPFAKQFKGKDITPTIDTVGDVKDRFMSVPGSFKGRFKGNKSPFRLDVGALELAQTMISDQAHFVSYRPIMQKVISTLSNPDVRRAINIVSNGTIATSGDMTTPTVTDGSTYKNLMRLTHMIANNRRNTALIQNEVLSWVNKQLSVNLPGGKPMGYIKQIASSLASLDRVSPADYVTAFRDLVLDQEKVMAILNSSPTVRMRDRNMMQEMRDVFVDPKFNTLIKNKNYAKAMMYFIKKGNQTGVAIGGFAVYQGTMKKTGGDVKASLSAMDQFIEETQQSASLTQTSLSQTGNFRVLFKFISAQQQYYRQMRVALADYQAGRIGGDELFRKLVVYQFILPVVFKMLGTMGLGGKATDYIGTSAVGSLTGIPVTGALLEAFMSAMIGKEYWKSAQIFPLNILDGSVDNVAQLIHATLDHDASRMWDEVIDIFQTVGAFTYVPIQAGEVAESLKATIDDEQGIRELVLTILGMTTTRSQKFISTLDDLL